MDLSLRTETFAAEDQSWLASAHGTSSARTITLDKAAIAAAVESDGRVKSGTPLARLASGKYGLYSASEATRNVLAGFLFTTVTGADKNDVQGALLDHGKVFADRCPNFTYAVRAALDVVGRIIFADKDPVQAGAVE